MTSYFDSAAREIHEAASWSDPHFLTKVASVETDVLHDINLIIGDREFPSDMRDRIQVVIAQWRTTAVGEVRPLEEAADWARDMRTSYMLDEIHTLFHELGTRRLETRFGALSDKPDSILMRRDEHDNTDLFTRHRWLGR